MTDNAKPQIYKKRYRVDEKLGAGNFGTAYLVTDLKAANEPKVLKVVRLGEMSEDQTDDSVREAQLLLNLNNEHIVKFYESFLENDCLCIVTEYCEGGDLDQLFKKLKKQNRNLDEDQITEWLIQILIAVQYMHKSRILHRDLKAKNIFLKSNKIKIGDFGISRVLVGTMDIATTFTGTPYYMSPEVLKHDGYESKSDIWSVGCLLYELCTNEHAFDGTGLMNVIYKVVEGKTPKLPNRYSKELNDLYMKMLKKDPNQRPSAAQMLQTRFIIQHRERTNLNVPLENTISGNLRAQEINAHLQSPITYGQMKKQSWTISSKHHIPDDNEDDDDINNNQSESVPLNQLNERMDDDEEQERTLRPALTVKSGKQVIVERKLQEAYVHGHPSNQQIRSNPNGMKHNQQVLHEKRGLEAKKQSEAFTIEIVDNKQIFNSRAHNLPYDVKFNNHSGLVNTGDMDDRPISPLKTTYSEVAARYGDKDDPGYHDYRSSDRNPEHGKPINKKTLNSRRLMSGSRHTAMNSPSRTIDACDAPNFDQEMKKSLSRTIGSAPRQRAPLNPSIDDRSATLRDNPAQDAYGPLAKDAKIYTLRKRAIQSLGESEFEKAYDYLVQQRTAQKFDPNFDEAKMYEGLKKIVTNTRDCFLVDQLIFLEAE